MLRPLYILALSLTLACTSGDGDDSGTGSANSTSNASTGSASEATTDDASTGAPTSGMTGDGTTTQTPTTGVETTDATTGPATTGDDTTTGVDVAFERFRLARAAGPCPPDADCDGFVELLASRTLRYEAFAEQGNPVLEAEISEEDFAAAVPVFASPALIALLDQQGPLCDPPTDIFEQMTVEVDGGAHEKDTTTCDQPELVAAREAADALVMQYFP